MVGYLWVFGCLAFIKELNHIIKLDDRSSPRVFIGYTEGAKAYRVLDLMTRLMRVARDVVFDEGHGWAWDKETNNGLVVALRDFTVEYEWAGGPMPTTLAALPTTSLASPTTSPASSATSTAPLC